MEWQLKTESYQRVMPVFSSHRVDTISHQVTQDPENIFWVSSEQVPYVCTLLVTIYDALKLPNPICMMHGAVPCHLLPPPLLAPTSTIYLSLHDHHMPLFQPFQCKT